MTHENLQRTEAFHRFVLLSIVELRSREETPVHSFDIAKVCDELLDDVDELQEFVAGGITRQRVIAALKALEEFDVLETEKKRSSVGKGRPAYSLAVEESTVLDLLRDDDQLGQVVDTIVEPND